MKCPFCNHYYIKVIETNHGNYFKCGICKEFHCYDLTGQFLLNSIKEGSKHYENINR